MTFAINPLEVVVVTLWLLGLFCAIMSFRRIRSAPLGILLIAVALLVPLVGGLAAIAVYALLVLRDRKRAHTGHGAIH